MSVPSPLSQHRSARGLRASSAVPLAVLVVSAAAAGAVAAAAPEAARAWTVTAVLVAWLCMAVTVVVSAVLVRRSRRSTAARDAEVGQLRAQLAQLVAESAHLGNVTLPLVAKRLRDAASAHDALTSVPIPSDPQLRLILETFASVVEQDVRHAAALDTERQQAQRELAEGAVELERLTRETLPTAVSRLREGNSADTVLAELQWPRSRLLSAPGESFLRELAQSERRAAAAQAASAKALSRVQAKAVSMLADLREMQERHGEEVFGDLLRLDHSTSQLGLMTDRLALLMGGRASRAWNKPIVMESILRGAVGRIAAYRRVRLHCSTSAAISGFAAEGVMHLLAELTDNAANFSPPIDEVHVYVEERSAGIVVTIEDSGLKMADAAMRRAEEAVAGRMTDLASLQGTRLGLAVVGRLAVKYGISVNYRPSSRGGTGVVVLLPPQLLAQQRDPAPRESARRSPGAVPAPGGPTRTTDSTPGHARTADAAFGTARSTDPGPGHVRTADAAFGAARTADAAAETPHTTDPAFGTARTTDGAAETPHTTDPASETPRTTDPAFGTAHTADPAPGHAHTTDPTLGTARTTDGAAETPHTTDPASETARTTDPAPGHADTTDPTLGTARTTDGTAETPHTTDPASGTTRTTDPAPETPHTTHPTPRHAHTTDPTPGTAHTTDGTPGPAHSDPMPGPAHSDPMPAPAFTADPTPAPAHTTRPDATAWPDAMARPHAEAERPEQSAHHRSAGSTPNGLPVRAPGRTMAEAERERRQRRAAADAASQDEGRAGGRSAARDAGARFGAFHRGRLSGSGATGPGAPAGPEGGRLDSEAPRGPEVRPASEPSRGPEVRPASETRPASEPPSTP
ncbi:ATP-binding protein [Streptomyces sp. NL15-2K]|uniref:ATP-binding protein n=1 Tax=Streptomyces sp. NL15-2K TaxID=376149 RepID=UPI00209BCE84|nr:ATP-binding protein [Streptomyces sp. NL15-2K]